MTDDNRESGGGDRAERYNPWLSMWLKPRRTIRQILDTDPHRHVMIVATLAAYSEFLSRAEERATDDQLPLLALLAIGVPASLLGAVIGLYFWGWLVWQTGRWLGGAAKAFEIRATLAWAMTPIAWMLPVYAVEIAIFGPELFQDEMPRIESSPALRTLYLAFVAIKLVLAIWTLVLLARSVAEAQGFGAWKGLGNLVLAFLLVIGVVLAVVIPLAVVAQL